MATNPYTSVSSSGYNSGPPADDGTEVAANKILWATFKTKLADVLKTFSESINANVLSAFAKVINTDTDEQNAMAGSLAITSSELTIATGAVTAARSTHTVDTESDAASDDLDTIATGSVSDGCLLTISAANTARTIVVKHEAGGAGQIHTSTKQDVSLDDDSKTIMLQRNGTDWNEVGNVAPIFTQSFASTNQTVTADTLLEVAHGLGALPTLWTVSLKNVTTEHGYVADDELLWACLSSPSNDSGVSFMADATNISIIQGNAFHIHSLSTFNSAVATATNWKWVVRAWK